ncbi:MAG: hypothetical protein P8M20_11240, partial [Planctomycetaceae bacterium]|nr:hypothetical protein [Planctomycetaceae bacterium]
GHGLAEFRIKHFVRNVELTQQVTVNHLKLSLIVCQQLYFFVGFFGCTKSVRKEQSVGLQWCMLRSVRCDQFGGRIS